jgi:N-hydroxyarylamine O-acetyltransferase
VIDLDAYLDRVGLSGRPGLAELHRAHLEAIPFENLDPHRGVAVAIDPAALQRKLVSERRGGYCFEQNLLLRAALEALGAHTETLLGRSRWNAPPGTLRTRTHAVLRVHDGERTWHADVGFGPRTLREPIPFGPGGPYEQAGVRFRVVTEGGELVLQSEVADEWRDVYAFPPEPVPDIDLVLSNWYTCTHPESMFVRGLIVSRQLPDGTRVALSDWSGELVLSSDGPAGSTRTLPARAEIPELLARHFHLPGFALGPDGRLQALSAA